MTLEDIKPGLKVYTGDVFGFKEYEVIDFLEYNEILCKFKDSHIVIDIDKIVLDDEKILYIKEYIENKDIIKDYYKMAKIFEERNSELYGLINI